MATPASRRKVVYEAAARITLLETWEWNARRYSPGHADAYVRFVKKSIDALADPSANGKPVPSRDDVRYLLVRRRGSGHGHIAVFATEGNVVTVLRIFHTAQDWQAALSKENPSS
jgi:plasmid stabilization system protein ParE